MTDTQPAGTPAADPAVTAAAIWREWEAEEAACPCCNGLFTGSHNDLCEMCAVASVEGRFPHGCNRDHLPEWMRKPADVPEPSTPPAQPPVGSRAAAGGHPGTLDGPGVLGRALDPAAVDALFANETARSSTSYGSDGVTSDDAADDQLCDDPDCGCCYPGGMEEAQPTGEEVIRYAAFVADVIPAEHRAATQAVIHGMLRDGWRRPAEPAPEPAGDGPGWEQAINPGERIHRLQLADQIDRGELPVPGSPQPAENEGDDDA